jgi:serine O-acetyltransferase
VNSRTIFIESLAADLVALGLPSRYKRRYVFTNRIAYYQRLLRLAEHRKANRRFMGRVLYLVTRLRLEFVGERMGFDIPLGVFGPGLSIAHRGTIVVNGKARVGAGCRIHPGVTIGDVNGGVPTLMDNVFLGPGCGVFGDIVIGEGSMLGPHVLVRESVPEASVVTAMSGQVSPRRKGAWSNPLCDDSV